jgi:hypothetical protein
LVGSVAVAPILLRATIRIRVRATRRADGVSCGLPHGICGCHAVRGNARLGEVGKCLPQLPSSAVQPEHDGSECGAQIEAISL